MVGGDFIDILNCAGTEVQNTLCTSNERNKGTTTRTKLVWGNDSRCKVKMSLKLVSPGDPLADFDLDVGDIVFYQKFMAL